MSGPFALQRPSQEGVNKERNPLGEIPFLMTVRRSVIDAIGALWKDDDLDGAEARSNWVLKNLYTEPVDPFPGSDKTLAPEAEQQIIALHLASLFLQLMGLRRGVGARREEVAQRYSQWVWKRVLEPRTLGEPHLVATVAEVLKSGVQETLDEIKGVKGVVNRLGKKNKKGKKGKKRLGVRGAQGSIFQAVVPRIVLSIFRSELPEAIRQEWDQDSEFSARLGLTTRTITTVGDVTFESEPFARAASKALGGKESTVPTLEKQVVRLHPIIKDGRVTGIWFDHPSTRKRMSLDTDSTALGVLTNSVSEREIWLRERRAWFDTDEAEFNQVVAEIAADDDASRRVNAVDSWLSPTLLSSTTIWMVSWTGASAYNWSMWSR